MVSDTFGSTNPPDVSLNSMSFARVRERGLHSSLMIDHNKQERERDREREKKGRRRDKNRKKERSSSEVFIE